MKIRNGFVSNSSSSSFVVACYNGKWTKKPKKVLSKAKETFLKKEGFIRSTAYYPDQVDMRDPARGKDLRSTFVNWVKSVTCNQDEVINPLLKNRISFVAEVHYQHYTMIYDGPTDQLLIAQNFGKQAEMAGDDKINFKPWRDPSGLERTTGKAYLEKYKALWAPNTDEN